MGILLGLWQEKNHKENKMKFAIVGLGFISDRHRQAIKHIGGEVILTCDDDEQKGADYLTFDLMCESEEFKEVDAVAILTPNYLHVPMIRKCLEKGKRVLCEKPLGISIEEVESLPNDGSVFCVLQLRKRLPTEIKTPENVELTLNFHRDQSYWDGWKGDESKSGGILYNLGVHYLDYLIKILGDNYEIKYSIHSKDFASGCIHWGNTKVHYKMTIDKTQPIQRTIKMDGEEINLSSQENLSYEDLHKYVYEDFTNRKGVCPVDALRAIRLIEQLKAYK